MTENRLHLGCGGKHLDGYINIDIYADDKVKPDRIWDLEKPLPYPDGFVEEILALHLFEHLKFSHIEEVMTSWYRVLKPGGKLIMEMPDFDQALQRAIDSPNDNTALASIFGSQEREGQFHHWGYNRTRLKFLLEGVGFKQVVFPQPQSYQKDTEPCLRVEAIK